MAAYSRYLQQILFLGSLVFHSSLIFAQEDTIGKPVSRVWLEKTDTAANMEIDTSDYLPDLYDNYLNYNLMIAASKGYASEIDRLIGMGAEIEAESKEGVSPLIYAVINNQLSAVQTLLKYHPALDKLTASYETPLIIAVKNNNLEISEALIRAGADIDFTDRNGASPLHYASINGYFEVTDLLLYYNATIDQKSDDGTTPLLAAVMAGYANVADLLIQNGADLKARNLKGFSPFLMAAVNGDTLIMDLLYKRGVDIYAANNAHYNALDLAISTNQTESAKYLLKIGNKWADLREHAVDPYVVATKYRRKEMISLLKENNIPGKVDYGIDQAIITLSSRFTFKDYYTGISLAFKEPFLNLGFIMGCDTKFWNTRVLIRDSEHLYHQYLDKGFLVYTGVFKDFMLSENPFKSNFILTTTLLAGYSFGHKLKGTGMTPPSEFKIIPDVTLKWNRRNLSLFLGLEYIKSDFYHIGPVWCRAGFSYNLYFDKVRTQVTPIKWN
jgi:ankyrin repeat protein